MEARVLGATDLTLGKREGLFGRPPRPCSHLKAPTFGLP
jgi:hypothetical protein